MSRYSLGRIEKDWTMVGLKTFWILISTLFLLAACVPQTKQTECGANEAFNASLRTCVPVVGGPSSFINISSFVPQFTQSRQKDDSTTLTFTIAVSNPYSQSYSVEWERVFNAAPVTMCSNALSCSFSASLLGTTLGEVGTHILTAKIKDGNGSVVDSHAFEIKVNDFPKPVINTSTLTPSSYAFNALPSDARIPFSFTIRNNNATLSAPDNYRTIWTIVKNGAVLYTESDSFTSFSLTGTNNTYLGVSPTSAFNPATLGVGSYIVRAVVQNDIPGEIVAEQQWNVIIQEPDLANVTTIAQPSPGVVITAHNGVAYPDFPALSWIYSAAIQPNFCVTVDDRDGTYAGDGQSIQVRWYLDGLGGDICTKETLDTPGTQTICLIDANNCDPNGANAPFDTALLQFSNANSVSPQTHKVTARLFDERTSAEFQRSDVVPSNGSYPIEWLVNNKPINTAPVLGFGSTQPTGCVSSGAFSRSSCAVTQGTDFTVSFTATDDFYSPIADAGEFNWDFKIKYNGADISNGVSNTSCTKAFGTAVTVPGASGPYNATTPNKWTCTMAVPDYVATGPLNPASGSYSVVATMQDSGSPVGGAGLSSQSLTWNLVVTESNSALVLADQASGSSITKGAVTMTGANFATELETINFNMHVTDAQVDNLQYQVSVCKDNTIACTNPQAIFVPGYTQVVRSMLATPDLNPRVLPSLAYQIPEDFLIGVHSPAIDIATGVDQPVFFKIQVSDVPSVLVTAINSDEEVFSMNVRNLNTAPTIDSSGVTKPAVGSTTVVYSGYPLTIDPGIVADTSGPASERSLEYQWYSKIGAGAWTPVTGASQRIIRYTPGNITSDIDLKLCVGDGTAAHTTASTGVCSGTWTVTPKKYLEDLSATGVASVEDELAVWYDDTNTFPDTQVIYSAYVDSNKDIFVEKTVKNAAGNIVVSTNTIKFPALQTGTPSVVTNLSITGSANSIYVAYIASASATPATMIPRIRRIDKFYDLTAPAQAKVAMDHPAPFGFSYANTDFTLTGVCTGGVLTCNFTPGDGLGGFATIEFLDRLTLGDTIEINGETFTADPTPTLANEICDSSACATVNSQAENLRDKINNSLLPSMHGITARTSGGIVEIYSQYTLDYLDFDGSIGSVPGIVAGPNGLGKIFISGGQWQLPLINASLGGAEQNNISLIKGTTDVHLRNAGLGLDTGDVLQEMGKVAAFDAKLNAAGELVVARISADVTDAGALSLFRYTTGSPWTLFDTTGGSATDQSNIDIFTAFSFESVKLATDAVSNPHYYVLAKEKTLNGGEYHIGRYNFELDSSVTPSENFLSTRLLTSDFTPLNISDSIMKSPDIISIPGFSEARIFFHSNSAPRIAKWTSGDMIACGRCESLNGGLEYDASARVGISQIANDITLGTSFVGVTQNTNDVVFALFSSDVGNDDIFKPQLAIINIEGEAIQSASVDATGMWRPPFVLD